MHSKYAYVGAIAVNYFHTGPSTLPGVVPPFDQGELLLFVHGAGSNAHTWHRQLAHFEGQHSAIALDFPGHGRSGGTEGFKSVEAYVEFATQFVDALRLRPFVFVGRAMGGAVGLSFALAHPERLRALVLVSTPAKLEIPQEGLDTWRNVMRGRMPQPFSTALFSPTADLAVMREAWMEQVKTDPRVRYFDMLACQGFDFAARASEVKAPTLVIAGRDDGFAPPEKTEALQRRIPNSQLVVIDDAGHTLASEQPERFNEAIEQFVTSLR